MGLFKEREKKIAEELAGKSPGANRFVMLLTAEPKPGMTWAEVAALRIKYTGYADIKTVEGNWSAAAGENPSIIENSAELNAKEWEAGANEEVKWIVLREEAETIASLIGLAKLEAAVTIGAGNKKASFAAKALKIEVT